MYSNEEKKAIEDLKELSHYCSLRAIDIDDKNSDVWARYVCSIQIIKNLIEKQDKTINEMAEYLAIVRDCPNEDFGRNLDCENRCNNTDELYAECWRMYFEEKIKEDK